MESGREQLVFHPDTNPLRLNDAAIRDRARELSRGEFYFNLWQLWYDVSKGRLAKKRLRIEKFAFLLAIVVLLGGVLAIILFGWTLSGAPVGRLLCVGSEESSRCIPPWWFRAIFVAFLVWLLSWPAYSLAEGVSDSIRGQADLTTTLEMPMSLASFRESLARWEHVYGEALQYLIDTDDWSLSPSGCDVRVVILCRDTGVLTCLAANGVAEDIGAALTTSVDALPADIPVLVIHDASAEGCALPARARAVTNAPVFDLGLRPRAIRSNPDAFALRSRRAERGSFKAARQSGLSRGVARWLAVGWWGPVGALPPEALISGLRQAAGDVDSGTSQSDIELAEYFTWPARPNARDFSVYWIS